MVPEIENDEQVISGQCPECNGSRRADVRCEHVHNWSDDRHVMYGTLKYRVLECRGCETIYFQKAETFSEDADCRYDPRTGEEEWHIPEKFSYWPEPKKRTQPEWSLELMIADPDLDSIYDEIYSAINGDMRVLAAIGIRTAFDRSSELLDIPPDYTFKDKLNALEKEGQIGSGEKEALDVLTDAGGAAAHRGWKPSAKEVSNLLSILEAFLLRSFIIPTKAAAVKKSVPARAKSGLKKGSVKRD